MVVEGPKERWLKFIMIHSSSTCCSHFVIIVHLPGARAFVPQDDRLHGFYTCGSYLKHYARLSGQTMTPKIQEEMNNLLKSLGLQEQAGTIVGDVFLKGLSGGQKRRLSIALEAQTCPKTFFLDEVSETYSKNSIIGTTTHASFP
jgi:ABC-type taurine transport system ATPase subunit